MAGIWSSSATEETATGRKCQTARGGKIMFGEFFGTCELLQFLCAFDKITNECADRAASAASGIRMMSVLPW